MKGVGRVFQRGSVWWIAFYHRGREIRQSAHSHSEAQARKLLKKRLGEVTSGRFIVDEEKITFEDLVADLKNDYQVNGKRSLNSVLYYLPHLRHFFGFDRAIDITPDRVRAYQSHRLGEGAANATVNREVATLGRMLSLVVNAGKLSRKPRFQMLSENNVRQGFLEHGDFLNLLENLPDDLRPLIEFLYLSGWRKGEAVKLEWRDVDLNGKTVRLRIENSKNKEARILPLTGRLLEIIEERKALRRLDCPRVFHTKGRPIKEFRKTWKAACVAAGVGHFEEIPGSKKKKYVGTIVHDLRRCAARNLSRAGVPEAVAMEITGHKTRSMYRRYRIVDERDLREATARLQDHLEQQPKKTSVDRLRSNG
jgi:integrase